MHRLTMLAAAAFVAMPLSLSASSFTGDEVPLIFGDSQSDPGNRFAAEGLTGQVFYYPQNQITDGDTWASQIGADFASGRNFAYAGGRAATTPGGVRDFAEQIEDYRTRGPIPSAVETTLIFLGANDLLGAVDLESLGPTPDLSVIVTRLFTAGSNAIAGILGGIGQLSSLGLDDFVVFGVPNLARAPSVAAQVPSFLLDNVSLAVAAFNGELQAALGTLPNADQIRYLDTFTLLEELFADPASIGITNTTDPCIVIADTPLPSLESDCGTPETFAFYDDLHWSETVHTAFAERVTAELHPAPVPLPSAVFFMMAGLGALAAACWTRNGAA
jgi:phospholipase/lecithinase/hemolysin